MSDRPILPPALTRHPDLVIADLADDEGAALDYCAELRADVRAYRELVSVLLEQLNRALHTVEGLRRALEAVRRDERADERRAA